MLSLHSKHLSVTSEVSAWLMEIMLNEFSLHPTSFSIKGIFFNVETCVTVHACLSMLTWVTYSPTFIIYF
jgi:hypothetical protein